MAGGSHVMKILGVLEYLEGLDSSADDDLVMMMDAYGGSWYEYTNRANQDAHREADIWFQLRVETLIERYYAINAAENARIRERLGRAAEVEAIEQTIIFGSGKRCAPNQVHTVACYPIPDSPVPMDAYGPNTDTIMGRNKYTSLRQRWLNSGYIIGPVKDLRPMFKRALEKVEALKDHPEWDNGSGGMDFMYVALMSTSDRTACVDLAEKGRPLTRICLGTMAATNPSSTPCSASKSSNAGSCASDT